MQSQDKGEDQMYFGRFVAYIYFQQLSGCSTRLSALSDIVSTCTLYLLASKAKLNDLMNFTVFNVTIHGHILQKCMPSSIFFADDGS